MPRSVKAYIGKTMPPDLAQVTLNQHQIEEFYVDCFAENQVEHFIHMTKELNLNSTKRIVDIGGGCGYFARALHQKTGYLLRVVDRDTKSIDAVISLNNSKIEGEIGDALSPRIKGDESIASFNLILHHLIGNNESETRSLQKSALCYWIEKLDYVFVNEYIYESFISNLSGSLIFNLTRSKFFSIIGKVVGKFVPSLKSVFSDKIN